MLNYWNYKFVNLLHILLICVILKFTFFWLTVLISLNHWVTENKLRIPNTVNMKNRKYLRAAGEYIKTSQLSS